MTAEPIRIFVAMPGSTMGEHAKWANIKEIKRKLLDPAAKQIGRKAGRKAVLVIEKDKLSSGPIHASMFGEAVNSATPMLLKTNRGGRSSTSLTRCC